MKILYLANALPYDGINHAGGKTFNYYFKKLIKEENFDLTVIGICKESELNKIDSNKYGYKCIPVVTKGSWSTNVKRVFIDLLGIALRKKSYGQSYYKSYYFIKEIEKLKRSGYQPDIIFLEWTNCVLMVEGVKAVFPNAKIIASEYDVAFLGLEREYKQASDKKKIAMLNRYEKYKKMELEALKKCDFVYPESVKDKILLVNEGVDEKKIGVLTPYFHDMRHVNRKPSNHDILFWGAMYRPENYKSVIWFIDNVLPLLNDTDVRFVIAGNNPPKELLEKSNDRVIVTGFVQDESTLFEESMCLVAPLLTGAGIKVKIIEALSAGIPILTNEIGIEGIPAVDGESYFHCELPAEYENVIRKILSGKIDLEKLEVNQRKVIDTNFNIESSYAEYEKIIIGLIKN